MTAFTATTTFRDGYDTFEEGVEYDAPLGRVAKFVALGWASSEDVEGLEAPNLDARPTLDVQDVVEITTSKEF